MDWRLLAKRHDDVLSVAEQVALVDFGQEWQALTLRLSALLSLQGRWLPDQQLLTYKGKVSQKKFVKSVVIHQTTPNQTLIFERRRKRFFQGPHRTILGHPKHVLHLVLSPNAIAKAFNVMQCIGLSAPLISDFGLFWANVNWFNRSKRGVWQETRLFRVFFRSPSLRWTFS